MIDWLFRKFYWTSREDMDFFLDGRTAPISRDGKEIVPLRGSLYYAPKAGGRELALERMILLIAPMLMALAYPVASLGLATPLTTSIFLGSILLLFAYYTSLRRKRIRSTTKIYIKDIPYNYYVRRSGLLAVSSGEFGDLKKNLLVLLLSVIITSMLMYFFLEGNDNYLERLGLFVGVLFFGLGGLNAIFTIFIQFVWHFGRKKYGLTRAMLRPDYKIKQ